jgi:DNA-binding PadR family transcriptional regulator
VGFFYLPRKYPLVIFSINYYYVVHIMLGEFEYLLITATVTLGEDAYGATIRAEIESVTARPCSIGALYTTIARLEAKGLLRTWTGPSTAQRGGRARRMVAATPQGTQAAREFYQTMVRASRRASWAVPIPGDPQ